MNKACSSIDETAKIGKNATIESSSIIKENVIIEDFAQVGHGTIVYPHSRIRKKTILGPYCLIGHPTKQDLIMIDHSFNDPKLSDFIIKKRLTDIGESSVIRSGTTIYAHTRIGRKLNTGHNATIREHTTIGDNCVIGTNTVLNGYTKIGDKTRINTTCAMPQSMVIGMGVFIAPLVAFSDNERALPGEGNQGAVVEDYVRIGIGAKILPNIRIGRGALIGAGAVVTKDVPERAIVYGVPSKVKDYVKDEELEKYIKSIMSWI